MGHLNADLIIRFITGRKSITKKELATKYLFIAPSQLSKERICFDPKEWYEKLFDLQSEKSALYEQDEATIIGALKLFIETSCGNVLDGVDSTSYKPFVMEILQRAHMLTSRASTLSKENKQYIVEKKSTNIAPVPVDNLPFIKNRYFSGRSIFLERLRTNFVTENIDAQHTTQLIYGLDGLGKTQLALEYAYDALDCNKYDAICWIDCADKDGIEKSCCYFLAKIGEREIVDAISQLNLWLGTNNRWLLILDDVNDDGLIERLMPKRGNGHILITAQQNKDFVIENSTIRMECMDEEESVEFFTKRTNIDDHENAKLIVERLGCFPLALEQAAAYIQGAKIQYSEFLALLNEYELGLFDSDYSMGNYERTIHTVWNIALDKLCDYSKQLLYCFVYMSANHIELNWLIEHAWKLKNEQDEPDILMSPQKDKKSTGNLINLSNVFRKYNDESKFSPKLIAVLTDKLALIKAQAELKDYSFVTQNANESLAMHALLQETTRYFLANSGNSTYLFSVWEVLQTRFNNVDLVHDDFRITLSLPQAKSLSGNAYQFLQYREELSREQSRNRAIHADIDMWTLEFQCYSFIGQYLDLYGEAKEADAYYARACEISTFLFGGGENGIVSSTASFTTIQEKHRRMRVNLKLGHIDVANALYEEVKKVLINSAHINPGMVGSAFENFSKLWSEFELSDIAKGAHELALEYGVERYSE